MGSILNSAEVVDLLCLSEAIHRVDQSKKKKKKKRKKHKRHNISKISIIITKEPFTRTGQKPQVRKARQLSLVTQSYR